MKNYLVISVLIFLFPTVLFSQNNEDLLDAARQFPPMPRDAVDLVPFLLGERPTFGSGTPFNDLEYTIMDFDYIDGENGGGDVFMPVDPAETVPGENSVKYIRSVLNTDLNEAYSAADTDRIILGTAEIALPFFTKGSDDIDNDYAVIHHFDYTNGGIQLKGAPEDYALIYGTLEDGFATEGYYLFYSSTGSPDLIAFIYPCDDLEPPISGNLPQNPKSLCNSSEILSLNNPDQFQFAQPIAGEISLANGIAQFGTNGKEVIGGVASDKLGNIYLMGCTDGDIKGTGASENRVFISQINSDGTVNWTYESDLPNGSLFFEAVSDEDYVYVCGRTLGSIPGNSSAGRWDGILLKLDIETGALMASDQWGNSGIDGYGNIILDSYGNLYVSGQGSPPGDGGTDDVYLVAKHRTSDLSNIWRELNPTVAQGFSASAEAWGGLYLDEGSTESDNRLVVAGWYIAGGGANCFVSVYEDLDENVPQRPESIVFGSPGSQADWVLDNVIDEEGNIYVAGYTTGNLEGSHLGEGDAYVAKYGPDLTLIGTVQFGTPKSDAIRKLEIDEEGNLYAIGYTYGDYAATNADISKRTGDIFVQKLDSELNLLQSAQYGTPHEERPYSSLNNGVLYIGGMTEGNFVNTSFGSFDGYAMALDLINLEPIKTAAMIPDDHGEDTDPSTGFDEVVVYNVITPNNNGQNDFLRIDGLSESGNSHLQIFNKNGILEFETSNYTNPENLFRGTSQKTGEKMIGTFLYILSYDIDGKVLRKTGYLQIF